MSLDRSSLSMRALPGASLLSGLLVLVALVAGAPGLAQPVRTPNVEAELVAEKTALVPGTTQTVALRLKIRDKWHTYWRNPGDSGLPTTLEWKLPAGITAGEIQWSAPKALPAGPLINHGYEGEVFHLVELAVPATLSPGASHTLAARADWLVCEATCIPEGADLALTLPVAAQAGESRWAGAIRATREALPAPLGGQATATGKGQSILLEVDAPGFAAAGSRLHFFPYEEGLLEPSGKQVVERDGERMQLTLPVAYQLARGLDRVAGVLVSSGGSGPSRAVTVDVPLSGAIVAGPKPLDAPLPTLAIDGATSAVSISLFSALLLAFGGGMLLNLMPCVFPVLSLKVMGFVEHRDSKATMHREALAYAVGVVASFVLLAVLLLALRAAGEQLGWGFQLQSPGVIAALAVLFFLLALNLSGVFEFGMLVPGGVAGLSSKNRTLDAGLSGVLAVVVASPCTAPFMGAALGYAITQSVPVTLGVFVALGLGMALPYVLIAWFPGWRRRLPRPGKWMERVKQLLAFPLYATVAWLAWVLGAQVDNDAVFRLAVALVCVALAAWSWRIFRGGGSRAWSGAAVAGLLGGAVLLAPVMSGGAAPAAQPERANAQAGAGDWIAFSPEKVAALTRGGQPVFVDFTAAWCVTCQVNKRLVLNDKEVKAAFANRNVALVRADWTRRDPVITAALAELGRNGVPVYVLHRPGKSPLVLPEVLQASMIHDALGTL